jgi:hypothetical protein
VYSSLAEILPNTKPNRKKYSWLYLIRKRPRWLAISEERAYVYKSGKGTARYSPVSSPYFTKNTSPERYYIELDWADIFYYILQ